MFGSKHFYEKEELLIIPEGVATVGGQEYVMDTMIVYPDGRTSQNQQVILDSLGEYTVEYSKNIAGQKYGETKKFSVELGYKSIFTRSAYAWSNGFKDMNPDIVDADFNAPATSGAEIVFSKDQKKTEYNGVINLKAIQTSKPVISFMANPQTIGKAECLVVWVTLTDIFDENNFIDVQIYNGENWSDPRWTHIAARACDAEFSGLDRFSGKYDYNGTAINHQFTGNYGNTINSAINLYFDYTKNVLYVSETNGPLIQVLDFDDSSVVSLDDLWGGFSSEYVKLSVSVLTMKEKEAHFNVFSVGGEAIDSNYFDTNEAKIFVDYGDFKEGAIPKGVKGAYYTVFDAMAINSRIGRIDDPEVRVVYKGATGDVNIPIEGNKFRTSEVGKYVISYISGSVKKNVQVKVTKTGSDFTYTFNESIPSQVKMNDKVNILPGEIVSDFSDVDLTYSLTCNGKQTEIDNTSYYPNFIAKEAGEYVLTVTLMDIFQRQVVETKTIVVEYPEAPIIDEPSLPVCFMNGAAVQLSIPKGTYYDANGMHEVEVKAYVDGVDYTQKPYVPTGDFTIQYVATVVGNASLKTEKFYDVCTQDVGGVNNFISSYFTSSDIDENQVNDVEFYYEDGDIESLYFKTSTNNSWYSFNRPVFAHSSSILAFMIDMNYNNCDVFNVYLQDIIDSSILIKLSFKKEVVAGASCRNLYINDVFAKTYMFNANQNHSYSFGIDNERKCIVNETGEFVADIFTIVNGSGFEGFTSNQYYVSYGFEGVTGETLVKMSAIGNQKLSSLFKFDKAKPVAIFNGNFPTVTLYAMGDTVQLPSVRAYDILNSVKSITVSITSPGGKSGDIYSATVNGSQMDAIAVTPTSYGQYAVSYIIEDTVGNKTEVYKYFMIIDMQAPVINVQGNVPATVKVGDTISLPTATVSDNVQNDVEYCIAVQAPNGFTYLLNSNSYVFKDAGVYYVKYIAEDESCNIAVVEFVVTVKAA